MLLKKRLLGIRLTAICLWIIFPIILSCLLYIFVAGTPIGHQWEMVDLIDKCFSGTLLLKDLWAQHDAHRPFLMRIEIIWIAWLTSWNTRVESFANVTVAFVTVIGLWRLIRLQFSNLSKHLLIPIASAIIFSTSQAENWLPGFTFEWFLQNLFFVISLILLTQYKNTIYGFGLLLLMMVASILAYSLVLWLVIGIGILLLWENKRYTLLFFIASFVALAIYFTGFELNDSQTGSMAYVIEHPLQAIAYVLIYIGSPLSFGGAREVTAAYSPLDLFVMGLAAMWGIIGISAAVLCAQKWIRNTASDLFESALPWLLMMLFVGLSAGLTMLGRLSQGVLQALSVRYTTVAGLFWIALVSCIVLLRLHQHNWLADVAPRLWRIGRMLISLAFVMSFVLSSAYGAFTILSRSYSYALGKQAVLHYRNAPASFLRLLHVNAELVRSGAATLEKWKIGPFAEANAGFTNAEILSANIFEKIADTNSPKITYFEDCSRFAKEMVFELDKTSFLLPNPVIIQAKSKYVNQVKVYWASRGNSFDENHFLLAERVDDSKSEMRDFYLFISPIQPIDRLKLTTTYSGTCINHEPEVALYRFRR